MPAGRHELVIRINNIFSSFDCVHDVVVRIASNERYEYDVNDIELKLCRFIWGFTKMYERMVAMVKHNRNK